jgi:hypothetical protein
MKKLLAGWILFLAVLPLHISAQQYMPSYKGNYVIHDNDDHRDTYTEEYLMALSHLGEIQLKGIITTYSPNEYKEFVEGRKQILDLAKKSGLLNLPKVFNGTNKKLVRPITNLIEDTKALEIDGSHFIVETAKIASKSNPLVIVAGGQLTSIANAYLLETSIADKTVVMGVFGAENIDYNAGLDAWAWIILLAKFKVVAIPIGSSENRGRVYMKPAEVPKERILTELDQGIPFFKCMYEKKHTSNWLPNEGDYDGHPAILLTRPNYVTKWTRFSLEGLDREGMPLLTEDKMGNIFQAEDASREIATGEFWWVMTKLKEQLE